MSETIEPLDANLQIALPEFEGPLDLLLHLIRKHELEILDLPIAFVTEAYLSYVNLMEKLNLDVAAEYLVMAATLAHIKSKMLLPQEPVDQDDDEDPEDELDPRAELIRRLLEYQKYKAAAAHLNDLGVKGRDVFLRGSDGPKASGPAPLAQTGLFKLLDAFSAVLKRADADLAFAITAEGISIQDRMRQLIDALRERGQLSFEELFEGQASIYDMVVTFLAMLEMAKRRLVEIHQTEATAPIHLRSTVISVDAEADEEAQARAGGSWDDAVTEDEASEDAVSEDTVSEDTVSEDTVSEDTVSEDTVSEDDAAEDDAAEDDAAEDDAAEDDASEDEASEDEASEDEAAEDAASEDAAAEDDAAEDDAAEDDAAEDETPLETGDPLGAERGSGEATETPEDTAPERPGIDPPDRLGMESAAPRAEPSIEDA